MASERVAAFLLFAVVAAVTPGPSNILLTAIGAAVGVRRGLPCLCGVAFGMGLLVFLVAAGLGSAVSAHPIVLHGLKWGGIGLLLWLAWKIATAGRPEAAAARAVGFWQAAALQWVNPKSWLVGASAVGAYLDAGSDILGQATRLGLLFAAVALPSCWLWLAGGAALQRLMRSERAARRFNLAMALLLAASVVLFLR